MLLSMSYDCTYHVFELVYTVLRLRLRNIVLYALFIYLFFELVCRSLGAKLFIILSGYLFHLYIYFIGIGVTLA